MLNNSRSHLPKCILKTTKLQFGTYIKSVVVEKEEYGPLVAGVSGVHSLVKSDQTSGWVDFYNLDFSAPMSFSSFIAFFMSPWIFSFPVINAEAGLRLPVTMRFVWFSTARTLIQHSILLPTRLSGMRQNYILKLIWEI